MPDSKRSRNRRARKCRAFIGPLSSRIGLATARFCYFSTTLRSLATLGTRYLAPSTPTPTLGCFSPCLLNTLQVQQETGSANRLAITTTSYYTRLLVICNTRLTLQLPATRGAVACLYQRLASIESPHDYLHRYPTIVASGGRQASPGAAPVAATRDRASKT